MEVIYIVHPQRKREFFGQLYPGVECNRITSPLVETLSLEPCPVTTFSFELGVAPFLFHYVQKGTAGKITSNVLCMTNILGFTCQVQFLSRAEWIILSFQVANQEGHECNYLVQRTCKAPTLSVLPSNV